MCMCVRRQRHRHKLLGYDRPVCPETMTSGGGVEQEESTFIACLPFCSPHISSHLLTSPPHLTSSPRLFPPSPSLSCSHTYRADPAAVPFAICTGRRSIRPHGGAAWQEWRVRLARPWLHVDPISYWYVHVHVHVHAQVRVFAFCFVV